MSNMIISTIRNIYTLQSTGGDTLINGEWFCHSLEDLAWPYGVKIKHDTCISPGAYKVAIRYSPSFKRDVLVLYTEDDQFTIKMGGTEFTYIYSHGGENAGDTSGCILHAFNRINLNRITGSAEHSLFNRVKAALDAGDNVVWGIVSDPGNTYEIKWEG